jgi:GTPase SAR1 family protein
MSLKLERIPSEIKKETAKEKKLNKMIPKPLPFSWIILGAVGAGKSSMLYSMINNKNGWFKNFFDKITIWQSTVDSNATWENIPNVEVLNEYSEENLECYYKTIQDQQQVLRDAKKKLHQYLFIFDDMITRNIVSHHKTSVIDHIFQTNRHNNVSIIICSQKYKQLNKTTRADNLTGLFVLRVNKSEIEQVAEEHSGLLDEKEFIKMYDKILEDNRGYLFIDYKAPIKERFRDTINDIIKISE